VAARTVSTIFQPSRSNRPRFFHLPPEMGTGFGARLCEARSDLIVIRGRHGHRLIHVRLGGCWRFPHNA
jgi:hypothetical protein